MSEDQEALPWQRPPGSERHTGLVVAAWVLAGVSVLTGLWIVAGPAGIACGFAASQRGDARGGPAMVAAGVALVLGAVVQGLLS